MPNYNAFLTPAAVARSSLELNQSVQPVTLTILEQERSTGGNGNGWLEMFVRLEPGRRYRIDAIGASIKCNVSAGATFETNSDVFFYDPANYSGDQNPAAGAIFGVMPSIFNPAVPDDVRWLELSGSSFPAQYRYIYSDFLALQIRTNINNFTGTGGTRIRQWIRLREVDTNGNDVTAISPSGGGALDPDLETIAALNPTQNQLLIRGASAWEARSLVASDIPNLDAGKITTGTFADNQIPASIARDSEVTSAINAITPASIGAATSAQGNRADSALQPASIGVSVQAYDADLAAIAQLATTEFGRSLLTLATASAVRAAINAQAELSAITVEQTFNHQAILAFSAKIVDISATSLTLSNANNGRILRFTANSVITVTCPVLFAGFNCGLIQRGTGQIVLVQSSTTITNADGGTKLKLGNINGSTGSIVYDSTNTIIFGGNVAA